ncbi:MAG: CopG family transcriptional regulator [Sulfurimonas sp.]|uniref:CopG family transcriptional regulator n=1 Tax=Sulfurimonas sp. TaxID=2022749 RepID=UPI0025E0FF92|nr:CopG family transcriptional regulator [Sulfurimonas sp.]MCK9492633.1 CopG family transcriptional regulator [Sulfurimonas sp.]
MKTVTMRVDDSVYDMIKLAAQGQKRNLSNFIEFATIQYLTSSQFVENEEMAEIMGDKKLVQNLKILFILNLEKTLFMELILKN